MKNIGWRRTCGASNGELWVESRELEVTRAERLEPEEQI